jgi:hypothetical protein
MMNGSLCANREVLQIAVNRGKSTDYRTKDLPCARTEVYSFISQKGGTGKSTLARQFAVLNGPSLLINRDPQHTTAKWWNRRRELNPGLPGPDRS